jgi:hypothetical protein
LEPYGHWGLFFVSLEAAVQICGTSMPKLSMAEEDANDSNRFERKST